MMINRHIAILFLFAACAYLVGHSVVPHHHHEASSGLVSHYSSGHHHHSDNDDVDPGHSFYHFVVGSSTVSMAKSPTRVVVLKYSPLLATELFDADISAKYFTRFKSGVPPSDKYVYCAPITSSSGLRAPPIS